MWGGGKEGIEVVSEARSEGEAEGPSPPREKGTVFSFFTPSRTTFSAPARADTGASVASRDARKRRFENRATRPRGPVRARAP